MAHVRVNAARPEVLQQRRARAAVSAAAIAAAARSAAALAAALARAITATKAAAGLAARTGSSTTGTTEEDFHPEPPGLPLGCRQRCNAVWSRERCSRAGRTGKPSGHV